MNKLCKATFVVAYAFVVIPGIYSAGVFTLSAWNDMLFPTVIYRRRTV